MSRPRRSRRWAGGWGARLALLRLLLLPSGSSAATPSQSNGWGTSTSQAPSAFTEAGGTAHLWAFIDGALTRRSRSAWVALWCLRLIAVLMLLGCAAALVALVRMGW
jgi:hypothetical protein